MPWSWDRVHHQQIRSSLTDRRHMQTKSIHMLRSVWAAIMSILFLSQASAAHIAQTRSPNTPHMLSLHCALATRRPPAAAPALSPAPNEPHTEGAALPHNTPHTRAPLGHGAVYGRWCGMQAMEVGRACCSSAQSAPCLSLDHGLGSCAVLWQATVQTWSWTLNRSDGARARQSSSSWSRSATPATPSSRRPSCPRPLSISSWNARSSPVTMPARTGAPSSRRGSMCSRTVTTRSPHSSVNIASGLPATAASSTTLPASTAALALLSRELGCGEGCWS